MNYEEIIERLLEEKHITVKEAIYLLKQCDKPYQTCPTVYPWVTNPTPLVDPVTHPWITYKANSESTSKWLNEII